MQNVVVSCGTFECLFQFWPSRRVFENSDESGACLKELWNFEKILVRIFLLKFHVELYFMC